MTDPLFSETVTDDADRRSVIVVGLPRSGSSFLSHVMSAMPDWYVFDDLYVARQAKRVGATGPLSDGKLDKLLYFLGWQIRARHKHGFYAIPNVAEEEVEPMNAALKQAFSGKNANWADLQKEWLIRLAERAGATHWGYKMPGAFRSLDAVFAAYPEMKAVFLMRAPEKVLASYKHMPASSKDGHAEQYHPLAYAIYWRMAARAWRKAQARWPERVMLLRFEDLVADPTGAAKDLSGFLGTTAPDHIDPPPRQNTSFSESKRTGLTRLEHRLVTLITRTERRALGFADAAPVDEADLGLGDFVQTTGRFVLFRARKLIQILRLRFGR